MEPLRASEQLHAIHAMMATGHRSVRVESHTLLLWGLAAATLILVTPILFTPERFPVVWQRAIGNNLFIAAVLIVTGICDFRLTLRRRRERDETLSFVQLQLTKVWWLLVGLVVVINLGMNFFGGGYLFYGIVLALIGIALYVHGLFSQQMLSWIGTLLIGLGLASVAFKLPFPVIEWLAISIFGLGFPVLAWLLAHPARSVTLARRVQSSAAWLLLVLTVPAAAYQLDRTAVPVAWPTLSLSEFRNPSANASGGQVVRIPAGTTVPLHLDVTGDVLQGNSTVEIPMTLARDLEVAMLNGRLEGRFRVADESWKKVLYNFHVRDVDMRSNLTPARGPEVNVKLFLSTNN